MRSQSPSSSQTDGRRSRLAWPRRTRPNAAHRPVRAPGPLPAVTLMPYIKYGRRIFAIEKDAVDTVPVKVLEQTTKFRLSTRKIKVVSKLSAPRSARLTWLAGVDLPRMKIENAR